MTEYDAGLREKHFSALRHQESRDMYDRTLAQCAQRNDGVKPVDQDMVFELCSAEDIKIDLHADIKKRGAVVEVRNGRQVFYKENPSLARLSRYAELQRKIRADLRITPARRAGGDDDSTEETEKDDFDTF